MTICIIVEGKNDLVRLKELLQEDIQIYCTYGIPSAERVYQLVKSVGDLAVFLLTDNDISGRRIRAILREVFPDAEHIYTSKGYAGVEGTPKEYLLQKLEKAGLGEYIVPVSMNILQKIDNQRNRKNTENG